MCLTLTYCHSFIQALESFSNFQRSFGELSNAEKADSELSPPLPLKEYCGSLIDIHKLHRASTSHPDFRIVQKHNFELSELWEIFFGKSLYMIVLIIVSGFVAMILANIASTASATNVPLNFGPFQQCPCEAFHQHAKRHKRNSRQVDSPPAPNLVDCPTLSNELKGAGNYPNHLWSDASTACHCNCCLLQVVGRWQYL